MLLAFYFTTALTSLCFIPGALSNTSALGKDTRDVSDPEPNRWVEEGVAFDSTNTSLQNEAEGFATDGLSWYLPTNTDGNKAIYKLDATGRILDSAQLPFQDGHAGSASVYQGWLYVPIQRPFGVWKASTTNFAANEWHPINTTDSILPWTAINPLNGRLYTARQDIQNDTSRTMYAFDRDSFTRVPEDDIVLGPTPMTLANLQGAVFTDKGHLILVTSSLRAFPYANYLFAFSARTGHCFGVNSLGDYGSPSSQTQSVAVRSWAFGSKLALLHVLQLREDLNFSVHSYSVPHPESL